MPSGCSRAWLEGQLRYRGYPGIVVGVVADQELVWAKGFGLANVAGKLPMTPQTKFRMASHSKLFTATAIMQLREQGKLRLDDPVSKYLPWFAVKSPRPDDPPITIEQLLTHSSGLPREAGDHWTTFEFPTREELKVLMAEAAGRVRAGDSLEVLQPRLHVRGLVVEQVSGETWADYVKRNIFNRSG